MEKWTKEEEQLLVEYSSKYITKEIAEKLGRSYIAIRKKAIKLGIKLHSEEDPWTDGKLEYLKDNINIKPIAEISKYLNMSYHRIIKKCNELGIEYISERWTDEEVEILREYAQKCHYTELVKVLPNRSVGAITAKAFQLKIPTISEFVKLDDETASYIKENWGKKTVRQIAKDLKLSVSVIYRYKRELNLPNVGQQIKWTKETLMQLEDDSKTMSKLQLAQKYNTTINQINIVARKNNIKLPNEKSSNIDLFEKSIIDDINNGLLISEICDKYEIKATTVRSRLKRLGILEKRVTKSKRWTKEEEKILIKMSENSNIYEIMDALGRERESILSKARRLGIKINVLPSAKSWTKEEDKIFDELKNKKERHEIAKELDRTEFLLKKVAEEKDVELKIRKKKRWTEEETEKLIEYSKDYTSKQIAYLLDRSEPSVRCKLKSLNLTARQSLKFWTQKDCELLSELAPNHTIVELSEIFDKSYTSIFNKMYDLNIKEKEIVNKPWKSEEDEILKELLPLKTTFEIARVLDRTEEALVNRAKKLGYKKQRKWTSEEEEKLKLLWGKESIQTISEILGRTESSIKNRVYVLNLGSQIDNNYEGLTIKEIANMFQVSINVILTNWCTLGLKIDKKQRSSNSEYSYVTFENLLEFLENNQEVWSSLNLEEGALGEEEDWLKQKRERDKSDKFISNNINKQQLLKAKKYYLEEKNIKDSKNLTYINKNNQ